MVSRVIPILLIALAVVFDSNTCQQPQLCPLRNKDSRTIPWLVQNLLRERFQTGPLHRSNSATVHPMHGATNLHATSCTSKESDVFVCKVQLNGLPVTKPEDLFHTHWSSVHQNIWITLECTFLKIENGDYSKSSINQPLLGLLKQRAILIGCFL